MAPTARMAKVGKELALEWAVACLTDPAAPPAVARSIVRATAVAETPLSASLALPSPRLWWPNGYGPQHRYRLTLRVYTAGPGGGRVLLDETTSTFGVRHHSRGPWSYSDTA
jgi:hypothetical protein